MKKTQLQVGDVVQIDPDHDPMFGGCFMIVTEPKAFGAQGAVLGPGGNGQNGSGIAYYRCSFENMEFIGHAMWELHDADDDDVVDD